jgi:hypothetical protein
MIWKILRRAYRHHGVYKGSRLLNEQDRGPITLCIKRLKNILLHAKDDKR